MFKLKHHVSLITAVLPNSSIDLVLEDLVKERNTNVLLSKARGTLLHEHWWKSWLPPISPSKTMLRMIVPAHDVDPIVSSIIVNGRLNQQALGAVFSTPSNCAYIGSDFHQLNEDKNYSETDSHKLSETLSTIFCSVSHQLSDRVGKAAIRAGAHGPIVYFAEGRGLRDRLGWLRVTKDSEQEVLMVIADDTDVENIFDAMAKAGEFHLPGRGLMYRLPIDKGMFNLPSRVSNHHYQANTQQIINAIDHLTGHTHWRDQSIFEVGKEGKGVGLDFLQADSSELSDQVCFSAIANRDQSQELIDLMLDAGAPGMNITYSRFIEKGSDNHKLAHANITKEYAAIRCILDQSSAEMVANSIESNAEKRGIQDLCVLAHEATRVAKYVHRSVEYRKNPKPYGLSQ